MIKQGDLVKVHYTGKLLDGKVFDSSVDKTPLEFTMGQGRLIEGFEKGMMGMILGEKKSITIDPSQAYGEVRPELIVTVPKENVPEDIEVGKTLQAVGPDNRPVIFVVREVKEDSVIVDSNHPLAGQTLIFDVEVVDIK